MDYNTGRTKLVLREYGRNIQNLVDYAITIEDQEERNNFAKGLIELMAHLNPNLKILEDYRQKLWDHLHLISDFKLEVEAPYPKPEPESFFRKPEHIGYPRTRIRDKHYGKNVESMIKSALTMADEPEKQKEYAECIANYMKLASSAWNKDYINDEIIRSDVKRMSDGTIELDENAALDLLTKGNRPSRSSSQGSTNRRQGQKGGRRDNNRGQNQGGGRGRKRGQR